MANQTPVKIEHLVAPERAGTYYTLPFEMPDNSAELVLRYSCPRHAENETATAGGGFTAREEINIIDLGLIDPNGRQVGASGSDKTEITVSETAATPGYRPTALVPGQWQILVGAYKVQAGGTPVTYEIRVTPKSPRWIKGDLHAHTLASDGVHTAEELAYKALRHGLDFVAVTDHNQMSTAEGLPRVPGVTLIPGVEWTHYKGHVNFLGIDQPYDGSFAANTDEEIRAKFADAKERGALIQVNHPFEEGCGFALDLNSLPFDCLEVWNGPMRESNLRALGLWQSLLMAGRKLPICGGSDYHRDTPFLFLGGPTTHVYALSAGTSDILAALRQGRSYITYAPNGPHLDLTAGLEVIGATVAWTDVKELRIRLRGLEQGDVVRLATPRGTENLLEAPAAGSFETTCAIPAPGFARVEVLRTFLPGFPRLPALISNPIYFE